MTCEDKRPLEVARQLRRGWQGSGCRKVHAGRLGMRSKQSPNPSLSLSSSCWGCPRPAPAGATQGAALADTGGQGRLKARWRLMSGDSAVFGGLAPARTIFGGDPEGQRLDGSSEVSHRKISSSLYESWIGKLEAMVEGRRRFLAKHS